MTYCNAITPRLLAVSTQRATLSRHQRVLVRAVSVVMNDTHTRARMRCRLRRGGCDDARRGIVVVAKLICATQAFIALLIISIAMRCLTRVAMM